MAVLVEAITVITRLSSIESHFHGGIDAFHALLPNASSCADAHLIRVGFMTPQDMQQFVDQLVAGGLRLFDGQHFVDVAVVDQMNGPTAPTPWLNIYQITEDRIQFAALAGTDPGELVVPTSWTVEDSLYRTGSFAREEEDSRAQ